MNTGASTRTISVRHVEVRSNLSAQQVRDRLLAVVPRLDPRLADMAYRGDREAVERERRDGPPLWLFEVRDMGSLLALEGSRTVSSRSGKTARTRSRFVAAYADEVDATQLVHFQSTTLPDE